MDERALFTDNDPFACNWLRSLIAAGHLEGTVLERDIDFVNPDDLAGHSRVHLFGGIGGWELALRLAGWDSGRPVWTGSCPCQPFSSAGKRKGAKDARHLWPEMFRLVKECRPPTVFGEQVASADGRRWLAGVFADLEGLGYACAAADLCAAGVGAPHVRQRLFWVADATGKRAGYPSAVPGGDGAGVRLPRRGCRLGHADGPERRQDGGRREDGGGAGGQAAVPAPGGAGVAVRVGNPDGELGAERNKRPEGGLPPPPGADAARSGLGAGRLADTQGQGAERGGGTGFWAGADLIPCRDGKVRRVEPGPQQMADGFSEVLGRLRSHAIGKIERELRDASVSEGDAREALRELWCDLAARSVQRPAGRFRGVHEAPVLLAVLRELAREGWRLLDHLPSACWQTPEDGLREMRAAAPQAARTPPGQHAREQRPGQPANALSVVSQAIAYAGADAGMIPHPLAHGVPGRVGMLRGFGNAVVPQAAALFVRAFLEAENDG